MASEAGSLAAAMESLAARCDAITALALDSDAAVSGIFSKKENARTADLSIAFPRSAVHIRLFRVIEWTHVRSSEVPVQRPACHCVDRSLWCGPRLLAFALVGGQAGWVLRPLVGSPNIAVEFVRKDALASNFLESIFTQVIPNLMNKGLWASLKLAGVVLFAFVLTGPSLYVFTVVCGCGLSAIRIIVFGLVVTATLGCLLASLAPILWIFTVSTESMAFIIVFSFILSVTAMGVAFRAVWRGPAAGPVRGAFVVWAVLYVVVALQTVTLLRPMLGPSDEECGESRQKCFFVEHFFESVGE